MEDSKAVHTFKAGYNCTQSILFNYAEKMGISVNTAFMLGTGLGAGMGRKQEVCGAVTGGILVLGALFGRGENEGKEKQDDTYLKVRTLMDAFSRETGTVLCREILDGCDLLSSDGQKRFADEEKIKICHACVDRVIAITDRIIG